MHKTEVEHVDGGFLRESCVIGVGATRCADSTRERPASNRSRTVWPVMVQLLNSPK